MSGGGHVIIQSLIESGKFTPDEVTKLQQIMARSVVRCSWLDSRRVAAIVRKRLRQP